MKSGEVVAILAQSKFSSGERGFVGVMRRHTFSAFWNDHDLKPAFGGRHSDKRTTLATPYCFFLSRSSV